MNTKILAGILIIGSGTLVCATYYLNQKSGVAQPVKIKIAPVSTPQKRKDAPVVSHESHERTSPPIAPAIAVPEQIHNDAGSTRVRAGTNPFTASRKDVGGVTWGSSYQELLRTFWNQANGSLTGRTVEFFQITGEEAAVITSELGKLQQEYTRHITANGTLIGETETSATFRIGSFEDEADSANLKFLEKLQSQVSEHTFNIMIDAMPDIARQMGWDGEPQIVTISKASRRGRTDIFRITMNCVIKEGKIMHGMNLEPVSRKDVIRLYGGLIENNNSRILE